MIIDCPQCRAPLMVNDDYVPMRKCKCGWGPDDNSGYSMKISKKEKNYLFIDLREAYNNRL